MKIENQSQSASCNPPPPYGRQQFHMVCFMYLRSNIKTSSSVIVFNCYGNTAGTPSFQFVHRLLQYIILLPIHRVLEFVCSFFPQEVSSAELTVFDFIGQLISSPKTSYLITFAHSF